jgi:hypothetical protein
MRAKPAAGARERNLKRGKRLRRRPPPRAPIADAKARGKVSAQACARATPPGHGGPHQQKKKAAATWGGQFTGGPANKLAAASRLETAWEKRLDSLFVS